MLLRDEEAEYLTNVPQLLYWLGVTQSPDWAQFTVVTDGGLRTAVRFYAATGLLGGAVGVPQPLFQRDQDKPYWLQILASQHAVYLRYNRCVNDDGFQRLSAQALAVLHSHPSYRLIVDLRDNGGGSSGPFGFLIDGLRRDPAPHRPGRVFGLVNQYTDSSATVDANTLSRVPGAVLIGQQPGDPIDEYGNEKVFKLPYSGITVMYTSAIVNDTRDLLAAPSLVVSPTIRQVLAGADPVLAAALRYGS